MPLKFVNGGKGDPSAPLALLCTLRSDRSAVLHARASTRASRLSTSYSRQALHTLRETMGESWALRDPCVTPLSIPELSLPAMHLDTIPIVPSIPLLDPIHTQTITNKETTVVLALPYMPCRNEMDLLLPERHPVTRRWPCRVRRTSDVRSTWSALLDAAAAAWSARFTAPVIPLDTPSLRPAWDTAASILELIPPQRVEWLFDSTPKPRGVWTPLMVLQPPRAPPPRRCGGWLAKVQQRERSVESLYVITSNAELPSLALPSPPHVTLDPPTRLETPLKWSITSGATPNHVHDDGTDDHSDPQTNAMNDWSQFMLSPTAATRIRGTSLPTVAVADERRRRYVSAILKPNVRHPVPSLIDRSMELHLPDGHCARMNPTLRNTAAARLREIWPQQRAQVGTRRRPRLLPLPSPPLHISTPKEMMRMAFSKDKLRTITATPSLPIWDSTCVSARAFGAPSVPTPPAVIPHSWNAHAAWQPLAEDDESRGNSVFRRDVELQSLSMRRQWNDEWPQVALEDDLGLMPLAMRAVASVREDAKLHYYYRYVIEREQRQLGLE